MDSARRLSDSLSGAFNEDPVRGLPALTHCGDALCLRGHRVPPHRHRGFEFLCLARGAARWRAGGGTFAHRMGEVFVARPGEWHASAAPDREETHQLWIGLDLDRLGPGGRRLARSLRARDVRLLRGGPSVEAVLQGIVRQVVAPQPGQEAVIRAYMEVFLALAEQSLLARRRPAERPVLPPSYGVQKALSHLERNLHRRVPVAELAAVATVRQPSHLCARFRREVGVTPAAHHLRARLSAARAALLQPKAGITEVALRFGFGSSQHFSTAFRRLFKASPRSWRDRAARS